MRDIYETAKDEAEVKRRLRGLVEYMKWRSPETLSVYEHYVEQGLDRETHDRFLDGLHTQVEMFLKEREQRRRKSAAAPPSKPEASLPIQPTTQEQGMLQEPDLSFIYGLAGEG